MGLVKTGVNEYNEEGNKCKSQNHAWIGSWKAKLSGPTYIRR